MASNTIKPDAAARRAAHAAAALAQSQAHSAIVAGRKAAQQTKRDQNAAAAEAKHDAHVAQQLKRAAERAAIRNARLGLNMPTAPAGVPDVNVSVGGGATGSGASAVPDYALPPGQTAADVAANNGATTADPAAAGGSSAGGGGKSWGQKHPVLKWTLIVGGTGLGVLTLYGYAKYRAIMAPLRAGKALFRAGKAFAGSI